MTLSLLVALSLAQPPPGDAVRAPVAVVLTSKRPGADSVSPKVASKVLDALRKEQLAALLSPTQAGKELKSAGFADPRTCQGGRGCIAKLAILLGPHAVVVGVDVGKVGKALAIHLEAVAADREEPLASLDVSASVADWSEAMSAPLLIFARDVEAGLALKRESTPPQATTAPPLVATGKPPDAPVKKNLTPAPKEPPLELHAKAPEGKNRTAAWALAGGATVAAGGAVLLGILSANDKAAYQASLVTLPDGSQGSTLSQESAQALASGANTKLGLAIGSAVLSAALGGTSAWLFLKD